MTRPFTGRHMFATLVVFFGIVIAVNFTMASYATTTFGGLVVENSYVASQKFNRWLDEAAAEGAVWHETVEDLLAHSDILSVHCASTAETRGLLDARTLALLPKGAVVVNTARGDIVNDDALIAALQSGHIAAAGLDVFNNEPNIDPRYRTLPNTFLLPHLGSATLETRNAMGFRALDNLDEFFAGRRPRDQIVP